MLGQMAQDLFVSLLSCCAFAYFGWLLYHCYPEEKKPATDRRGKRE